MKLSSRAQKITSGNFGARHNHNDRTTFSETVEIEKSEDNVHFKNENFKQTIPELWEHIRTDFLLKKDQGIIPKKTRFLKKTSTKNTKSKDGKKKSEQVETSIVREFFIQIGKENDHLSKEQSFEIYEKAMRWIEEKYKLSVLNYDFHADETTPHLHFMATTYDFETGLFSKEFNKPNSYAAFQKDLNAFINTLVEVEIHEKKECEVADYISPAVYRRNKPLLEKAQKYCLNREKTEIELSEALEALETQKATNDTLELEKSVLKQDMSALETNNHRLTKENKKGEEIYLDQRETINDLETNNASLKSELKGKVEEVTELEQKVSYLTSLHSSSSELENAKLKEDEEFILSYQKEQSNYRGLKS